MSLPTVRYFDFVAKTVSRTLNNSEVIEESVETSNPMTLEC